MKKTLDSILAEHPFPKGLSRAHLKFLAGCARNVRFEEGSFLLREGQGADHFFLIRRGRVSIEIYAPGRGAIPVQ
ncbi:MAG: Crp/Fnr family transcriptional regulator, partial [Elusimicrobiota bacterium]